MVVRIPASVHHWTPGPSRFRSHHPDFPLGSMVPKYDPPGAECPPSAHLPESGAFAASP